MSHWTEDPSRTCKSCMWNHQGKCVNVAANAAFKPQSIKAYMTVRSAPCSEWSFDAPHASKKEG